MAMENGLGSLSSKTKKIEKQKSLDEIDLPFYYPRSERHHFQEPGESHDEEEHDRHRESRNTLENLKDMIQDQFHKNSVSNTSIKSNKHIALKMIRDCLLIIILMLTFVVTLFNFIIKQDYHWVDQFFNYTVPVILNKTLQSMNH